MAGLNINIVTTLILAVALFVAAAEGRVLNGASSSSTSNASSSVADGRKVAGLTVTAHICDDLTFTKVCYALTKIPGVTTPRSLLEAAVRVSLEKARTAKARFAAARKSSREGNPMASILQSCANNYDDLVSALEEAQQSIQAHGSNYNVVSKMTAASTYAGDCDNWFDERSIASPYEPMQRQVARVVSITLGIAAKTKQL